MRVLLLAVAICVVLTAGQQTQLAVSRFLDPPLRGVRIAIDPGHGGIDDGTQIVGRYPEKNVNLQLGLQLRQVLKDMGAQVLITRETDRELSRSGQIYPGRHREDLARRVEIIENADCDLFVSLHCNSAPGHPESRGPIVYYHPASPTSGGLAEKIQTRLNRMNLQPFDASQRPHTTSPADYYLLRHTTTIGVLVEAGFMSNATDLRLLVDEDWQQSFAVSLALGIVDYLHDGTSTEIADTSQERGLLLILPVSAEETATWVHCLSSPLPLTFLLKDESLAWRNAAETIWQAGHDLLLHRSESSPAGSSIGNCYSYPEAAQPCLSRAAIGAPTLTKQSSYQVNGVITASNGSQLLGQLTQILQSTPSPHIVLLETTELLSLDDRKLWLQIGALLREHGVRPIFASDLFLPGGEPEEMDRSSG